MTVRLDSAFEQELLRCKTVPWYFAQRYLKIATKAEMRPGDLVAKPQINLYAPRPEQVLAREMKYKHQKVYVLKARQVGMSLEEGADKLEKCLFNEYWVHGVVAHTEDAANAIFQKVYVDLYDRLPPAMKKAFPLVKCNDRQMRFKNGSEIVVTSAESPSFAGRTFTSMHFSEFARYKDPDRLFSDVVVSPNGYTLLETTAEGYNRAYDYWAEDNDYYKLFFPWMTCPDYVSDKRPRKRDEKVEKYATDYNLTVEQKFWLYQEIGAVNWNWSMFNQKYPATPELAFVSSGERYFSKMFERPQVVTGIQRKGELDLSVPYVMGVDTASGSPTGDYSAWVILNVKDCERPKIVSTFYGRVKPQEFANLVLSEAQRYQAVVNIESNSYGLSILDYVKGSGYGRLARQETWDASEGTYKPRYGFATTAKSRQMLIACLSRTVDEHWFDVWDERLQSEIIKFARIDGKEQAGPGGHDDIIMALALALVCVDQRLDTQELKFSRRPKNVEERVAWFQQNGRFPGPDDSFDDDDDPVGEDYITGVGSLPQVRW